jgi:hypothetical protein
MTKPAIKPGSKGNGDGNERDLRNNTYQNQMMSQVSTPGEEFVEEHMGRRDIGARGLFIA